MRVAAPLLFVTMVLVSCSRQPTIVGSWQRLVRPETNPFVLTLTFNADGTYQASHNEGTTYGEYVITGDHITIMDDDCYEEIGKYTFTVSGQALTFTLVSDPSNRPEVLPGKWIKK